MDEQLACSILHETAHESKQSHKLGVVSGQTKAIGIEATKLALVDAEQMHDLGPNADVSIFDRQASCLDNRSYYLS